MAQDFQKIQDLIASGVPSVTMDRCLMLAQDMDQFYCCGDDPPAWAIKMVTGSSLSHVGSLYWDRPNLRTLETTFTKNMHQGYAEGYLKGQDGPFILARLAGMTPSYQTLLLTRALELVGKKYEVGEEVEMLLHKLCPLFKVQAEYRELFCSGEQQDILTFPGTPWVVPNDPSGGNSTPVDLWRLPFVQPVCVVMPT